MATKTIRLIATMGLPASGKSTWAAELAKDGWAEVVNKDDIRAELASKCVDCGCPQESHGGTARIGFCTTFNPWFWSRDKEKDVIRARDSKLYTILRSGKSAISSDCNLGRKHKVRLEQIARECGAEFEIKRFDVPLDICLERNAKREAKVPEKAIREMYNQFIVNDPDHWPQSAPAQTIEYEQVKYVNGAEPAIMCDLDGTLALFKHHRGPFDASKCDEDELNPPVWHIINAMSNLGYRIFYCSGREDTYREPTERFLAKHTCPKGTLLMRGRGDHRKDAIVKRELFDANIRGRYNVSFVLDDRDQVVKMWRALGLTCLQVADGAF